MNTQEIQEQLQDHQEFNMKLDERLKIIEDKKIDFPEIKDYDAHFDEIKLLLKKQAEEDKTLPLQEKIHQQAFAATTFKDAVERFSVLIRALPEEIKVGILHRFEDKTRAFIIGGIILLLFSSVSIGISLHLWSENGRMHENDVKFRMVKQIEPSVAFKADTLYHRNPVEMERKTKQLEAEQLAIAQAEAISREIGEKAARAKENVFKLKKRSK